MDSTNFQHHEQQQQQHQQQLQDHFVGCSPLNIPLPSYGVVVSNNNTSLHHWNNISSSILPTSTTTTTSSNTFSNKPYENEFLSSTTPNSSIPKIEDSDMLSSFPSFSGLLQNHTPVTTLDNINPWSFNGLLSSGSGVPYSRGLMQQYPLEANNWNSNNNSNNNTSINQGYPSTSFLNQLGLVSSPNNSPASTVSSSSPRLGLNLQAMDFLGNNSSFSSQSRPMSSYDVVGEEVISPAGKIMSNKNSSLMNGSVTGTKRAAGSSNSDQCKASTSNSHASTKKSPLKVSCPPFKVRKEKLGERIAALHQLVSPFGKTDTASVLTEAIGYIQFLQDQIHTLCMPHPKPSRSKPCRPFQVGLGINEDDGKEEERVELGRRGLCLVPFSWTSYITPNQLDGSNHPPYY